MGGITVFLLTPDWFSSSSEDDLDDEDEDELPVCDEEKFPPRSRSLGDEAIAAGYRFTEEDMHRT